MGKRKVNILQPAVESIAEVAFFIESKGMPETAKKFVDEVFTFFEKLGDTIIEYGPCKYKRWKELGYSCVNYKGKYIIAYLRLTNEITICDFVSTKILKE